MEEQKTLLLHLYVKINKLKKKKKRLLRITGLLSWKEKIYMELSRLLSF